MTDRRPICKVSHPLPHVLLITLDREKQLNAIDNQGHWELDDIVCRFEEDESLWVAILTGTGRAFCAGADLKEWLTSTTSTEGRTSRNSSMPAGGFGALSNRSLRKPVIAAVNGIAFGGGMEILANCDMVIVSEQARLGLPEVKRGVSASAGALPRLARTLGIQRASEMALTGRVILPLEALSWGIVNKVVPHAQLTDTALAVARELIQNSPDSIIYTKAALREGLGVEEATRKTNSEWKKRLDASENLIEGLTAFSAKRAPKWSNPKL